MKLSQPLQEAGTIITLGFWQSRVQGFITLIKVTQLRNCCSELDYKAFWPHCLHSQWERSGLRALYTVLCAKEGWRTWSIQIAHSFINHICWGIREAVHYSLEIRASNSALLLTTSAPVDKLHMCFEPGVSLLSSVRMNGGFRITMKTKWCVAWKMYRIQFEEGLSGQESWPPSQHTYKSIDTTVAKSMLLCTHYIPRTHAECTGKTEHIVINKDANKCYYCYCYFPEGTESANFWMHAELNNMETDNKKNHTARKMRLRCQNNP